MYRRRQVIGFCGEFENRPEPRIILHEELSHHFPFAGKAEELAERRPELV